MKRDYMNEPVVKNINSQQSNLKSNLNAIAEKKAFSIVNSLMDSKRLRITVIISVLYLLISGLVGNVLLIKHLIIN